jgi:drug/metabolite transporter (DMT)-like permease
MDFATIGFGLLSAIAYGIGDFSAGYSSRRTPVLMVLLLSQFVGLILLFALALLFREGGLSTRDLLIGAVAGIVGLIGLLGLYQGLATGQMSIVAPITAVLSTGIPVLYSAVTQCVPETTQIIGFLLALIGVWMLSTVPTASAKPSTRALLLALVGGTGFGVFYILLAQVEGDVVFMPLAAARFASVSLLLLVASAGRRFVRPARNILPIIILAGIMDAGGNALFLLSEQAAGRLDIASVLASLYPVTTVLLALVLLRERLNRFQILGIVLVFAALPLITYQVA